MPSRPAISGPPQRPGITRRGFLSRAASAAAAAGGLGTLIAACDSRAAATGLQSRRQIPGPGNPIEWPILASNPPIASGLPAERHATLEVFCPAGQISPAIVRKFAATHHCRVHVTTFTTINAALAKLTETPGAFDVILGIPNAILATLIPRQLIQPLNHSYLPKIRHVWPKYASPYYDRQSRYTVPFTVYTTGIAWRRDKVPADPYATTNGWAFPWQARYAGKVAILDDYREAISLGLLYNEITDLNTADPRLLDQATSALEELAFSTRLTVTNDPSANLASGQTWIQHARSGQAVAALNRMPSHVRRDVIGYWFPPDGAGPVASDLGAVPRGSRSPVLAHMFLNFLLDHDNAVINMRTSGYMQPLRWLTPQRLVREGVLPNSLVSAAVVPTFIDHGLKELELLTPTDELWHASWQRVLQHL